MSAVTRALKTEIAKLEKRLERLKEVIDAEPMSRIFEIGRESAQIIEKHRDDYATIAKLLEPLKKEEKRMYALAKKQEKLAEMIDDQIDLEFEIRELKDRLFWEEKRAK
jgi:hypothetical protein